MRALIDSEFPGLTYHNEAIGSIRRFKGNEQIKEGNVWVRFDLEYHGCLIIPK